VLTYSPADLQALPNHVPFIIPLNSRQNPTVPAGATAKQIRVLTRAHTNDMQDWNTYPSTDNALKQQLLDACPHIFLETNMHTDLGVALVSTLTILTHLWDTYGSITHADIMANNTTLITNDWHPPMPMEGLFTKIICCVDYAAAGSAPISAVMAVQAAYNNIEATGLFTNDCKVWRNKPAAEKTYALLKEFFTNADQDHTRVTASAVDYHGANSATVATATELLSLQAKVAALEKQLCTRPPQQRTAMTTGNSTGALTYCHTHGISTNSSHTSATCKYKGPLHQDDATINDRMGGSEYVYSAADAKPRMRSIRE
jgi:hypothetical protein